MFGCESKLPDAGRPAAYVLLDGNMLTDTLCFSKVAVFIVCHFLLDSFYVFF